MVEGRGGAGDQRLQLTCWKIRPVLVTLRPLLAAGRCACSSHREGSFRRMGGSGTSHCSSKRSRQMSAEVSLK